MMKLDRQKPGITSISTGLAALFACAMIGVVATPALAAEGCPNEQLRVEDHSTLLPDCRAYELVSPPYKAGQLVGAEFISEDGMHVIGSSLGSFAGGEDNQGFGTGYDFARNEAGWVPAPFDPPASQGYIFHSTPAFVGVSADFSRKLFVQVGETSNIGSRNIYIREPGGSFTLVGPELPPSVVKSEAAEEGPALEYKGASSSLSHVLFAIPGPTEEGGKAARTSFLWPGDSTAEAEEVAFPSLYEYEGTGNHEPALVGVGNVGRLSGTPNLNDGAQLISSCGTYLGSERPKDTYNAVSQSGTSIFFTATHAEGCAGPQPAASELYVRINGEATVAISEPAHPLVQGSGSGPEECDATCEAAVPQKGRFQGASEDGSKVFFLTEQPLLNGDTDTGLDLYEAEIEEQGESAKIGRLIQVSHDPNVGQAAEVQGVARVSENGERVYFVAEGVLTGEPNTSLPPGHQVAVAGEDNMYVREPDREHPGEYKIAFVATLTPQDEEDWQKGDNRRVQATSGGGRFLLFASHGDLNGEGLEGASQLFRYDATTGEVLRVSIGQDGFNRDGDLKSGEEANSARFPLQSYGGSSGASPPALSMSADGSYVFFESSDGLTPQALNAQQIGERFGTPIYANNVYEYYDGNVQLISDGQDLSVVVGERPVVKLNGIDASGDDVFFETSDPLVGQDTDTGEDVYDARIDGGFPAPMLSPGCLGDQCQGPPGVAPSLPSAGSSLQPGGGNLMSPTPLKPVVKKLQMKPLTRVQKLSKALRACGKKPKVGRAACVKQVRKKYGVSKAKKSERRGS